MKLDIANLSGIIDKSDFSTKDLNDVKMGMVYICTITEIDYANFRIKLRLWKEENHDKFDY